MRTILAAVGLMALMVSAPAWAQKKEPSKQGEAAPQKTFDFSDEAGVLEADFLRPNQGVAEAVVLEEGPSLIRVRTDFVDEILKSAEDL